MIIKYIPLDRYINYYIAPEEDRDKYKPIPTLGLGKEVSVMISNFFPSNEYNYMKINKDDENKQFKNDDSSSEH